jgi:acetyl-CoA carboxylase biotin carboxylase subunit
MERVLVANRGEIAVRIVDACHALGLEAVLAVSEADRESLAAQRADRVLGIGPSPASKSYLRADLVVHAAVASGCTALHPGYGFLSEQPELARLCAENGVTFVGPPPEQLEALGDKLRARELAREAGVAVAPGGPAADARAAAELAEETGYPLLVKAAHGGGGRGMKLVESASELERSWRVAAAEAKAAFGDGTVFVERFVERAKHVEVQIAGDAHGGRVHLGERECSVQHRHQKVIEEAPSPALDARLRGELHAAALRIADAIGYLNLGTVEFLYDSGRGELSFLEVNPRLQVEHPVTEAVTGLDLVREQLRIAAGEPLSVRQEDVRVSGHALECRITAQDPSRGLAPSPGRISRWRAPEGVRVDTHAYEGYEFPPHYDALLAKAIAQDETRDEAIERMLAALREWEIGGLTTSLPLHERLLQDPVFRRGEATTGWLDGLLSG